MKSLMADLAVEVQVTDACEADEDAGIAVGVVDQGKADPELACRPRPESKMPSVGSARRGEGISHRAVKRRLGRGQIAG